MSNIRRIGRNISFMAMNRVVAMIVAFFMFPFIVRHVGKEVYGVYLMVITITGYFGILDMGVMSALTKYVSEYNGNENSGMINKIITASFTFYVLIGVVISVLLLICSQCFSSFFKIDVSNIRIVKELLMIAGLSALFVWPLSTFRGAIQGLNLWNVDASINIAVQLINAVATFLLLSAGYGIVQIFIISQLLMILGNAACYYVSKKRMNVNIIFPYAELSTFKLIFNFSIFMFFSSAVAIFLFQIHNILIGYFLSMSAVTIYAVAFNIQNYFRLINSTLGASPWTMASEMQGRGDYEGQKKLLFKGTKYTSAVFVPIVLIMFFFTEPFIRYWMGPDFNDSIIPARIIILFWIFNGTLELAAGMLSAKGVIRKPLFIQIGAAALNIIIGLLLIKILGVTAMAIGLALSMILISFPFLLSMSLKMLNITFKEYYDKSVKNNLFLYATVILLSVLVSRYFHPNNMIATLTEMSCIYFISISLYYLLVLDKYEKHELFRLVGLEGLITGIGEYSANSEI